MDLSIIGRRQNREITGPTPHSVAIVSDDRLMQQ